MGKPILDSATLTLEKVVGDIIESIAMEETAVSHILNAESEKIMLAIGRFDLTAKQLIEINLSVKNTINEIIRLESIFQSKLDILKEIIKMSELPKEKALNFCCNAPCEILHSIALEEAALSHILNAEGEKIQKAVATTNISIEDLLRINNSVTKTIREVTGLELVLLSKLETICFCNCNPTPPIPHEGRICIFVFDCKTKKPLEGAEIVISKNNEFVARGCTDKLGKYTSEFLAFGIYCVNVAYKEQEKRLCDVVIEQQCCCNLNFCFDSKCPYPTPIVQKYIKISGQVTDNCNNPLANVCIHAKGTNTVNVYTNQCGYYEICQLVVSDIFYVTPIYDGCRGIGKQYNCINQSCYKVDFKLQ